MLNGVVGVVSSNPTLSEIFLTSTVIADLSYLYFYMDIVSSYQILSIEDILIS